MPLATVHLRSVHFQLQQASHLSPIYRGGAGGGVENDEPSIPVVAYYYAGRIRMLSVQSLACVGAHINCELAPAYTGIISLISAKQL